MADFSTDARGGIDDRVRLELGGQEVLIAESYEVSASILSQPARFSLRLGHGDVAKKIIQAYPVNTPFRLSIGNVLQQSGRTDGYHLDQSVGATEVTIFGRDALAPVHDGEVEAEMSFTDDTYASLVRKALDAVGLNGAALKASADADRKLRTGVPVESHAQPTTDPSALAVGRVQRAIQCRIGEPWFHFVRRYLDRAGLFLWGAADGSAILSAPNINQAPAYRILRRRGQTRNDVNVTRASLVADYSKRHTTITVYARSGGRKYGRAKAEGAVVDEEMVNDPIQNANGEWVSVGIKNRNRSARDANVHTVEQAEFLANRLLAEERRESWRLEYTLAGHTTPSLVNGGGRAVWTPDTLVEVVDDEFGLNDTYWIESVEHRRAPQTETTIRLLRRKDCLFGTSETEE